MNNQPLPIESRFEVERLRRYIKKNPEDAPRLAIQHFEDYLFVVQKYMKLEQERNSSPSLPSF